MMHMHRKHTRMYFKQSERETETEKATEGEEERRK